MAAIILTVIVFFVVGGFLFRKRTPRPEPPQFCCPYCKRRATRIKFSFECSDCGETVIGSADVNQSAGMPSQVVEKPIDRG